jgi:hypothetical protein
VRFCRDTKIGGAFWFCARMFIPTRRARRAPHDVEVGLLLVGPARVGKSSGLGDRLDVSRLLDDGLQPVDRDVFIRELTYYQIGAESSTTHGSDTR